jgi:hypothetical protein
MPYLIDRHNLINFLPDIELEDPHDEVKLVFKLRGFCAQKRRRRCVVVFDQGLPGGRSNLSTPSVEVIFASYQHSNADRVLHERIQEIQDVQGWTVVSSDNEVCDEALRMGMKVMKSGAFVELLFPDKGPKPHEGINPHVSVPQKQVDEWLNEFGVDDSGDSEIAPRPQAIAPKQPEKVPPDPTQTPQEKAGIARVQQKESDVEQWLEIFGEAPAPQATDKPMKFTPRHKKRPKKKSEPVQDVQPQMKSGDIDLNKNTVDAWLEVFGEQNAEREPTDPAFQRSEPSKQGRYRNHDGKREPLVHKRMGTAPDIHLSDGEVDAWMEVFGMDDEEEKD